MQLVVPFPIALFPNSTIFISKLSKIELMEKAKVYLFTSPTCPHCPSAKSFIQKFKSTRDDFDLVEYSTMSAEGQKKAERFDVRSVPTFIIKGQGHNEIIGLRGSQSESVMNKYLDVALGKKTLQESREEKKPFIIKIGKLKIKF